MADELRSSVKVYSGGIAVVTREYALPEEGPLKLSIPVKKRDLDAVVTSLSVFGDVTLPEPPSYPPANLPSSGLQIDSTDVTKALATRLRGARVRVTAPGNVELNGTLAGTQEFTESLAGGAGTVDRWRVVVLLENGEIRTVEDRQIQSLLFTNEQDRREIEKALHRAYQEVKPDSSFVDLTIVPSGDSRKCAVSYTTTAPAPKTRYQLRQVGEKWELEAQAVVTNDSEEDWQSPDGSGVFLTVITGDPIDFDTDFSLVSRPRRSRENLANESVLGAVSVEEASLGTLALMEAEELSAAMPQAAMAPVALRRTAAGLGALRMDRPGQTILSSRAQQPEAEIRESGDFTVFECPDPVIIGSNRSAIVPLRTWEVREVQPMLVFKEERHPRRPWRAARFKNDTGSPLGKGVVIVYQQNDFAGKAVLEPAQKGEEAILIHALENGVKIHVDRAPIESRRVGIHIREGAVLCESVTTAEIQYKIQNKKQEAFGLEIEHSRILGSRARFEVSAGNRSPVTTTTTVGGARFGTKLAAEESLVVVIREVNLEEQQFSLPGDGGASWLEQNILSIRHPLAIDPGIQACIAAQEAVSQARQALEDAQYQADSIEEEQERLKGIIPVAHDNDANDLKTDVASNEKKWRALKRETIPALKQTLREREEALHKALTSLSVSWREGK